MDQDLMNKIMDKSREERIVYYRADLPQANLPEANLWQANLPEANLWQADLRQANLRQANLKGTNLRQANLWQADLRQANLQGADLKGANLKEADLWGADLRKTLNLFLFPNYDTRNHILYAIITNEGIINIGAGCRLFHCLSDAKQHWGESYGGERFIGDRYLYALKYVESEEFKQFCTIFSAKLIE